MKKNILCLSLLSFIMIALFSSCRQDDAAPIRNVRFDPQLINRLQTADNSSCSIHKHSSENKTINFNALFANEITVAFDTGMPYAEQQRLIKSYGVFQTLRQPKSHAITPTYALALKNDFNCRQIEYIISELNKEPGVKYAAAAFPENEKAEVQYD